MSVSDEFQARVNAVANAGSRPAAEALTGLAERIRVIVEEVSPGVQTFTFDTLTEPGTYVFEPDDEGGTLRRTGDV